jgi:hypothetical protein
VTVSDANKSLDFIMGEVSRNALWFRCFIHMIKSFAVKYGHRLRINGISHKAQDTVQTGSDEFDSFSRVRASRSGLRIAIRSPYHAPIFSHATRKQFRT